MSNSAVERGEPLIHVSKRVGIAQSKAWAIRGAALVLALMISGLVIFSIVHLSPLKVYGAMSAAFGKPPPLGSPFGTP